MKNKSTKRAIRSLSVVLLAFCVAFTSLPLLAGNLDASAMAKKKKKAKVATKITLYASAYGQNGASLSWNKIKKPEKGYAVFRDGHPIAHLGKKKLSFTDSGLSAGSTHYYQIKVYKTKKVKQWYNKKTGTWQKKKPKKKDRGKRRTITTYTYKRPSKYVYITTVAAPKAATPAAKPTTPSTGGGTSGGSQTTPTATTKTVTDYRGVTRTITKEKDGAEYIWVASDGKFTYDNANGLAKWDKTQNGTFTDNYGSWYQVDGATFNTKQLNGTVTPDRLYNDTALAFKTEMYNGIADKLSIEIDRPTEPVTTCDDSFNIINTEFVMKDGFRLVEYYGVNTTTERLDTGANITAKSIIFGNLDRDLSSCGFVSGDITITIKYNGKAVGSFKYNPNPNANSEGLHPYRAFFLDVAMSAVNGSPKSFAEDWQTIRDYVNATYEYPPYGEGGSGPDYLDCIGGARVLETYSIYVDHKYGYLAHPKDATNKDTHIAFYLNEDTQGLHKYEAQGYKVPGKEY